MTEHVELDEDIVQRAKVKVRRDDVGFLVIRGVLDGRKLIDRVFRRHDDHARRVLTGGALDAHAARHQAVHLHRGRPAALFLTPLFDVAVSGLVRQSADGTCLEHLPAAEELLDVFVRAVLIDAGEVQVDIGDLVAVEAEEDLEGDIVAVVLQVRAAAGAFALRQVDAAGIFVHIHVKVRKLAVGADVMRRQRVDLGDVAHGRGKRRADRSARADEEAVLIGLFDEQMRRIIQRAEAVAEDGLEFPFQPRRDDFGQRIAVNLFGVGPCHGFDLLLRIGQLGLEGFLIARVLGEHLDLPHHVRNFAGIVDHDLPCAVAQVGKLVQHFPRGAEIKRRLLIRIVKPHARHQDFAEHRVLRIHKVHITGRADRLAQLVAQAQHALVQIL